MTAPVFVSDAAREAMRQAVQERLERSAAALRTVSARDLLANPPARPIEVIPGLLPAGLSLLASAPKVGKSWLAYQEAVAVVTGGDVLGSRATRGDVLYLALEDGEHRAWDRITRILRRTTGGQEMPAAAAELEVAFNSDRGDALVEQVEDWLARHPEASAVLVDTLQKVRPMTGSRLPQYAIDVADMGRMLGITQRHPGLALQVVHHDTKASRLAGSDFVDAVSGTSGLAGSSDTILVLRRKRHEATGTLEVVGKDIREGLLRLVYDADDPFWSLDPLGGMTEPQLAAYRLVMDEGPMGSTALGRALGVSQQAAYDVAEKLVAMGALEKEKGLYSTISVRIRPVDPVEPVGSVDPVDPVEPVDGGEQAQQAQQAPPRAHARTKDVR